MLNHLRSNNKFKNKYFKNPVSDIKFNNNIKQVGLHKTLEEAQEIRRKIGLTRAAFGKLRTVFRSRFT